MTAGIVVFLVLLAAAVAFIVAPLLRADAAEAERVSRGLSEARELQSEHDMVLASLKDLEDDRATDKIDEADYEALKARLTSQAVDVMKRMDAKQRERDRPDRPRPVRPPDAEEAGPTV